MTKQSAFVTDDAVVAAVVAAQASPHFQSSFPRSKDANATDCKKHAAITIDLAATGVVQGRTWVETMKASSPCRTAEAELGVWMEKHPSALTWFEAVLAAADKKQVVMFLDYDGTLSPIVEDPDHAFMSEEMRDAVRGVAKHFPTAIVSGRCRDKVHTLPTPTSNSLAAFLPVLFRPVVATLSDGY